LPFGPTLALSRGRPRPRPDSKTEDPVRARYVGLDLHKHFIEVCAIDAKGKVVFRGRAGCLRHELEAFARAHLKKTDRAALEATTNTWAVVDVLRPFVAEVVVGNPLKTRAIAEARVKTDKVDAEVLAQLLRCDYLPTVWQPDDRTQHLRGLLTHRAALMTQRSRAKNHIQCLLARLLLRTPCKVLWTKAGMAWLKALELPACARLVRDSELRQIAAVDAELAEVDKELAEVARTERRVQLLMTIPGVNFVVALGLLSAWATSAGSATATTPPVTSGRSHRPSNRAGCATTARSRRRAMGRPAGC
jgi:transposase